MIAFLYALLVALSNGATDVRSVPTDDGSVIVEYTAAQCPSFDDEPCYVIVTTTIETGP